MTGRGEDAIRMEKRLRCAGRAIGADIQVVSVAGELLIDRLVSTEELESMARPSTRSVTGRNR